MLGKSTGLHWAMGGLLPIDFNDQNKDSTLIIGNVFYSGLMSRGMLWPYCLCQQIETCLLISQGVIVFERQNGKYIKE